MEDLIDTDPDLDVDVTLDDAPPTAPAPAPVETASVAPVANPMEDAIKELTETIRSSRTPATNEPAAPQMSEEELRAHWGVWNPTEKNPAFFEQFFRFAPDMDPEEKKTAVAQMQGLFGEMQTGIVRQALIGAQHYMTAMRQELESQYAPLMEQVQYQKAEALKERFYGSYPVLQDERFAKIVKATAAELVGKQFPSEAEYFKALAEGAGAVIKGVLPDFDLAATVEKKAATTPRLPRTRAGGTGGSGGSAPKPVVSQDDSDAIFD